MLKRFSLGFVFLFFVCALPQLCFAQSKKIEIACFVRTTKDPYLAKLVEHIEMQMDSVANLTVYDANDSVYLQLEQVQEVVKQKPDLVFVNSVNPVYVTEILDILKKHKIPSIFYKNEPNAKLFQSYENAVLIGNNSVEEGRRQGMLISLLWDKKYDRNNDGKVQFILLQGAINNYEAINRSLYSIKTANELGLEMEQLGKNYVCSWDREQAYDTMAYAMTMYKNDVELIIANNDTMALGALDYLQEIGLNIDEDTIPIVGFDGTDEALEKINEGVLTGTVVQDPAEVANLLKVMAINFMAGRDWLYASGYYWSVNQDVVRTRGGFNFIAKDGALESNTVKE